MKQKILTSISAIVAAGFALTGLPQTAEAGHPCHSHRRCVDHCSYCGKPVYAYYRIVSYRSCGTPVYGWVTQHHHGCRDRYYQRQRHEYYRHSPPSHSHGYYRSSPHRGFSFGFSFGNRSSRCR